MGDILAERYEEKYSYSIYHYCAGCGEDLFIQLNNKPIMIYEYAKWGQYDMGARHRDLIAVVCDKKCEGDFMVKRMFDKNLTKVDL